MQIPNTLDRPKTVVFNGITYRLMGGKKRYYLSQSATNADRKNAKGLHVAIWETAHKKKARRGIHIHHIDNNPFNNDISNLESLSVVEHRRQHPLVGKALKKQLKHLNKVRPLTKAWHKSPEGREWHRQHGHEGWKNIPLVKKSCVVCSKSFMSKRPRKYCSHYCSYQARVTSGHYDFIGNCVLCGKEFSGVKQINPSRTRKTCSSSCAIRWGQSRL